MHPVAQPQEGERNLVPPRRHQRRVELRAVTGPDYGRIYDHELVAAVQKIAGNGTGDTRWKVPGVLDWSTGVYNPDVDISKNTTTLYASDRDVFLFLTSSIRPMAEAAAVTPIRRPPAVPKCASAASISRKAVSGFT